MRKNLLYNNDMWRIIRTIARTLYYKTRNVLRRLKNALNQIISNECYMCPVQDYPAVGEKDSPWNNPKLKKIKKKNDNARKALNIIDAESDSERLRIRLKRAKKELTHLKTITESSGAKLRRAEKSLSAKRKKQVKASVEGGPDDSVDANSKINLIDKDAKKIRIKRVMKSKDGLRRIKNSKGTP